MSASATQGGHKKTEHFVKTFSDIRPTSNENYIPEFLARKTKIEYILSALF